MRSDAVFSTGALQAHLTLVALSGIALAASIQPASRIAALRVSSLTYPPTLFPLAVTFLFGVFAVSRGAAMAASAEGRFIRSRLLLRVVEQMAFGLLILLPYHLFSRALLPAKTPGMMILVVYSLFASVFLCLASLRLEARGARRRRGAFLLRYGFLLAVFVLPVPIGLLSSRSSIVLALSPIGFAMKAVEGISVSHAIVGFAIPTMGIILSLTGIGRIDRRHHAV
jgi:hypothetical protein